MKYIRLINPKNETVFVKEIQVVISEVLYNPANYINFAEWDVINVNPCKNAFKSIEDALDSELKNLRYSATDVVRWHKTKKDGQYRTGILTNEIGDCITDTDINLWKQGYIKLYMKDVYITLY